MNLFVYVDKVWMFVRISILVKFNVVGEFRNYF